MTMPCRRRSLGHAHSGPFRVGDRVQLTDPKGRMHTLVLEDGQGLPHAPRCAARTTT